MNNTDNDMNQTNDALAEMQQTLEPQPSASSALDAMKAGAEATATAPKLPPVDNAQTIKTIREIDNLMGDFFRSLKPIDEQFAKIADGFFLEASKYNDKKKLTDEETAEALANVALGVLTKGVGNLLSTVRTTEALANVKQILKKDADAKLEAVNRLSESTERMEDAMEEAFKTTLESGTDQQVLASFDNLRNFLYNTALLEYLKATYTAAKEGKFQDWMDFPTMSDVNLFMMSKYLDSEERPETASDEAYAKQIHSIINALMAEVQDSLDNGKPYSRRALIFASDPGIMSLALCISNPLSDEEATTFTLSELIEDDENLRPLSLQQYLKFMSLTASATTNTDAPLSENIRNNATLQNLTNHYTEMVMTGREYEERTHTYYFIVVLMGLTAGMASYVNFDLVWYWAVAIAVAAWIILWRLAPWSSLKEKYHTKITCIDRTIQLDARKGCGYEEIVNLADVEEKNNKAWLYAILGAVVGFLLIPIPGGLIIGALAGFFLGKGGSVEAADYDYTKIDTGKGTQAKILLWLMVAVAVYYAWETISKIFF